VVLGAPGRISRIGYVPATEADKGWSRLTLPKDRGEFPEIDPDWKLIIAFWLAEKTES
jgi:hypothetical protein